MHFNANMQFKEFVHIINPRVPKRMLLFLAGFIWLYASYRVFLVLLIELHKSSNHWLIYAIGSIVYVLFFQFVFHRILLKHTKRIINKATNWVCVFSVFDLKSYLLMGFMIATGVLSTRYLSIPAEALSVFFISLSLSLFTSALYFLYYGFRYSYAKNKFLIFNKLTDEN